MTGDPREGRDVLAEALRSNVLNVMDTANDHMAGHRTDLRWPALADAIFAASPEEPPHFGLQYLHGSHKGPNPPTFCRGCGRRMVLSVEPDRYEPFDAETGEPKTETHARCPRPWWQVIGFGAHDHAVSDGNGGWPWL